MAPCATQDAALNVSRSAVTATAFGATAASESFEYQKAGYHQRCDFATPNFAIPRQRDVPTLAPAPSLEKQIHRRKMRSTAATTSAAGASTTAGAAAESNMKMAIGRSHSGAAAFDLSGHAANRTHSEMRREYHTRQGGAPALTINGRRRPSLSVNPTAAPAAASVSSSRPGDRLTRRGSADVALLCGSKGGGATGGGDNGGRILCSSTRATRSFSPWDSELPNVTTSLKCDKTLEDCAAICLNMEDIQGMAAHKDLSRILISSIDIVSVPESLLPTTASPPAATTSPTATATASAAAAAPAATSPAATSPAAAAEYVLWGVQFTDSPAWIFRSPNGSFPVPQSPAMGNTTGTDKTRRSASRRSPLSPHSPPLQFPHSHSPPPRSPPLQFPHSHSPPPHSPPLHSPHSQPASPHKLASTSAAWKRPTSRLSPTGGSARPLVPRSSSIPEFNTSAATVATPAATAAAADYSAAPSAARPAAVAATCAPAVSSTSTLPPASIAATTVPSTAVVGSLSGALMRQHSTAQIHSSAAEIHPLQVDILPISSSKQQTPEHPMHRPVHHRRRSLSDIPSSADSSAFSSPFASLSPSSAASHSPSSVFSPRFSRFEPSQKHSPENLPAETGPAHGTNTKPSIPEEASGVQSGVLATAAGSGSGSGSASSFGVWVGGSTRPTFADALAASRLSVGIKLSPTESNANKAALGTQQEKQEEPTILNEGIKRIGFNYQVDLEQMPKYMTDDELSHFIFNV